MNKQSIPRILFYIAGLLILALGIILNTKCGLGVSPIISVAFSISAITHCSFGNMTFLLYAIFVLAELLIHLTLNHRYHVHPDRAPVIRRNFKLLLVMDLLQLPLSLVFTRFMNLFSAWIPAPEKFGYQLLILAGGIICTGIGAAMSLNMRIIPNPGDGIVQAISDFIGKSVGFTKNCFDLFNICLTCCIDLIFAHHLIGNRCCRFRCRSRDCLIQSSVYEENDAHGGVNILNALFWHSRQESANCLQFIHKSYHLFS